MPIALYQLYDAHTKQRTEHRYNTLRAAREARRAFNRSAGDPLRYIVIPGPAHPKYKP